MTLGFGFLGLLSGEPVHAAEPRSGAAALKADLLGVFAHPDDETGVAAAIAHYALQRKFSVAHVYCTRGEGGGNMVGTQAGQALGLLREQELRECLRILGVRDCFFLDRTDFAYTESLSVTFERWNKEAILERLVRVIRLVRPEVMITMNPAPTPGQHGNHQAAGVLATEAFDAAADASRFPHQLQHDGLEVWRARKLYYGGNIAGAPTVATIDVTQPFADGKTPAQIAGEALSNHRSQGFGSFANAPWLRRAQSFSLVRSVVPFVPEENDLFQGLSAALEKPALAVAPGAASAQPRAQFLGRPAVARYRAWIHEQKIGHVASAFIDDIPVVAGEPTPVRIGPVGLANLKGSWRDGPLQLRVSEGWSAVVSPKSQRQETAYDVVMVNAPATASDSGTLAVTGEIDGQSFDISARLHPLPKLRAAKLSAPPELTFGAADSAWNALAAVAISHTNRWQGAASDAADCSATFRVGHDGRSLFLEIQVRDDQVVGNIDTNDIKGHWRSDSIEICLDPTPGSEHTLGCYKIGIFPFDRSGRVRGARDADANAGPIEQTAPNTRLASQRTADGYAIRAAIPLREAGFDPRKTRRLGFNVLIYDGDKQNAAPGENINECRLAWVPRAGIMGRPEDWGRLDLE